MNQRNDIAEEKITIPSEIRYVREISSKIIKELGSRNVGESALFDIKLCVEEIVRNAIQHGNLSDKRSRVRIHYRIKDGLFTIEVEDSGSGFNHNKVPDPTHKDNIFKGSGRGVYLVRRLMDKVEYSEKGNKVKLTKRLK